MWQVLSLAVSEVSWKVGMLAWNDMSDVSLLYVLVHLY